MKDLERLEVFNNIRDQYLKFLTSVLWKLTGDRELFAEALQYSLLGIWQHVEKLNSRNAHSYIYRIALSANSKAWQDRIGKDGRLAPRIDGTDSSPGDKILRVELAAKVRYAISQLPVKQSGAIVMRYLEQQDYETIAQKLGCSQESARSHVSKGIATLKSKLAKVAKQE